MKRDISWHIKVETKWATFYRYFQMHSLKVKLLYYNSIQISLKFVPKCPIDFKSVLSLVMAWYRTDEKPLSFWTNIIWWASQLKHISITRPVNILRLKQNGCHFPDDILKWISLNENVWISMKNTLKFVPKDLINNIPALVQINCWCWAGNNPLPELMINKAGASES